MASKRLALEAGQWYGWQEIPVPHPGWGPSPIFIVGVQPLKTGKGILRLSFIQALHPVCATQRTVDLRVAIHTPGSIAGTFAAADGSIGTATISVASLGWIKGYCPPLWQRRPPKPPSFIEVGAPPPVVTASDYLNATLGADEARVLLGATRQSFGCKLSAMPKRTSTFDLELTAEPFNSWLIARGFVPDAMEEKWFIYLEPGRLVFRRSWTGIVIYTIEAEWRGDCLYLGRVVVNRNPRQYSETDDVYDRRVLIFLIEAILLGVPALFPMKDGLNPTQAALHGWSTAGKASL